MLAFHIVTASVLIAVAESTGWQLDCSSLLNVTKRRATNRQENYWSSRVVPYTIGSKYKKSELDIIKASMRDWEEDTCLTFRPKQPGDKNYIEYKNLDGCYSNLGMSGGKQIVSLGSPGCISISTINHEIGHALGLVHEHQHPDRDSGIRIVRNNVQEEDRMWFEEIDKSTLDFFDVKYDMDSVMHYSSYAFTKDSKLRTMETRDASLQFRLDNYHKQLSFSDVLIVNRMLRCSDLCKKKVTCGRDGFVDKNCVCQTPEAFHRRRCVDRESADYCMEKVSQGMCDYDYNVAEKCIKMCDFCPMYGIKRKKLTGGCENRHQDDSECEKWKREGRCDDLKMKRFLATKCAKTCGLCGVKPECLDDYADCASFPDEYCRRGHDDYTFMMDHCKTRCGQC